MLHTGGLASVAPPAAVLAALAHPTHPADIVSQATAAAAARLGCEPDHARLVTGAESVLHSLLWAHPLRPGDVLVVPEAYTSSLEAGCRAHRATVATQLSPCPQSSLRLLFAPFTAAGLTAVATARAAAPAALVVVDASDATWSAAVCCTAADAGADLVLALAAPALRGAAGVGVLAAVSAAGFAALPALPPHPSPALAASLLAALTHAARVEFSTLTALAAHARAALSAVPHAELRPTVHDAPPTSLLPPAALYLRSRLLPSATVAAVLQSAGFAVAVDPTLYDDNRYVRVPVHGDASVAEYTRVAAVLAAATTAADTGNDSDTEDAADDDDDEEAAEESDGGLPLEPHGRAGHIGPPPVLGLAMHGAALAARLSMAAAKAAGSSETPLSPANNNNDDDHDDDDDDDGGWIDVAAARAAAASISHATAQQQQRHQTAATSARAVAAAAVATTTKAVSAGLSLLSTTPAPTARCFSTPSTAKNITPAPLSLGDDVTYGGLGTFTPAAADDSATATTPTCDDALSSALSGEDDLPPEGLPEAVRARERAAAAAARDKAVRALAAGPSRAATTAAAAARVEATLQHHSDVAAAGDVAMGKTTPAVSASASAPALATGEIRRHASTGLVTLDGLSPSSPPDGRLLLGGTRQSSAHPSHHTYRGPRPMGMQATAAVATAKMAVPSASNASATTAAQPFRDTRGQDLPPWL